MHYLDKKWSIKECWKVHKELMIKLWLPYVEYNAFYSRLKQYWWDLYRAVHTPLDYSKLERHEKTRVWIRTQRLKLRLNFKLLFK